MKNMELKNVPIGTTIRFYKNGKERYLRKIRITEMYWSPWYDPIRGESVRESSIPSNWQIL